MASKDEGAGTVIRQDVRHMREAMSRDNLEEKLEHAVDERPAIEPFLDLRLVAIAVAVAAVLTLLAVVILSVGAGAIVLVLSFFATWAILAMRSYDKRRPTTVVEREKDAEEGGTDPAPFSG
jgi:Flp pilus assembly protein TadB